MSRLLLPLLILTLGSSSAFSQPTRVTLPAQQARRIADSLTVLPLVRREAATWQRASQHYAAAADSLAHAAAAYQRASQAQQAALDSQGQLLRGATAEALRWKQRARRRGLLNWVGFGLLAGAGYLVLVH